MDARRMGLCVAILVVFGGGVRADEEKVPLDKVPRAVLDAVKAKFPKAKINKASTEKEDGKTVFEINLKSKGAIHEVTVTPEGKILSIEKEIKSTDLPQAVSDALAKKYPKAKITKAEEVTKDDKVAYEMLIVTDDKKNLEVVFDPTGKFVKEEKKESEKKEKKD